MAIKTMVVLQVRRGPYGDFEVNKDKLTAGEPAATLQDDPNVPSGKAFYVCFGAGDVRRLVSIEDLEEMVSRDVFKGDPGDPGVSVTDADIDDRGHLMISLSDGTQRDAGLIDDALELIQQAVDSAEAAKKSEQNAAGSEQRAKGYADNAGKLVLDAADSEQAAGEHAKTAQDAADTATGAAGDAETAKTAAELAAGNAQKSETAAQGYAGTASTAATTATEKAGEVAQDAEAVAADKQAADKSAGDAEKWAKQAESFAHGGTTTREDEDTDNAKYYLEQTRAAANSITGALKPKGNITFDELEDLSPVMGDYYNVTEAFTSDERFADGAGIDYPAGTDIYYTDEGKWNAVQGAGVAGVKGHNESAYRKGLVDITPDNIGLDKVENKTGAEILAGMKKEDVTKALGYEPPVDDTQGINLISNDSSKWLNGSIDEDGSLSNSVVIRIRLNVKVKLLENKKYTLWISNNDFDILCHFYKSDNTHNGSIQWGKSKVITTPSETDHAYFLVRYNNDAKINPDVIGRELFIKFESGTVTDPVWTPAPKDIQTTPQIKRMNLEPAQWTGDAFPYLYTISLPGTTATQRIYATAPPGLTEDQINAFADACITGNSQTDGQIVLQAVNKPVVELPIVIEIGGEVVDG